MTERSSTIVKFSNLGLSKELENPDFRNQFFRTEREIDIPFQIKSLRKLRKMKQEELADITGTQQSAISRLERSQDAKWELETLVRLAEGLSARLSVVIEPFEDVIARYRAEEAFLGANVAEAKPRNAEKPKEKVTSTAKVPEYANVTRVQSAANSSSNERYNYETSNNRIQPTGLSNASASTFRSIIPARSSIQAG